MKRTILIILVALLVILSTMTLVACRGNIKSEEEWNSAMDYLKNCETVTINYNHDKTTNARTTKTHEIWTVQYDRTKGALYAEQNVKVYNLFDVMIEQTRQYQYVEVSNLELKNYTKKPIDNRNTNWKLTSQSYSNEDEAMQQLHQIYLSYITLLNLDNFNYNDFTYKFGKYEKSEVVNQKNTSWQLTFSDGKMATAYYETKHKRGSSDIDYTKINITMQYSAEITIPTDLEQSYGY